MYVCADIGNGISVGVYVGVGVHVGFVLIDYICRNMSLTFHIQC